MLQSEYNDSDDENHIGGGGGGHYQPPQHQFQHPFNQMAGMFGQALGQGGPGGFMGMMGHGGAPAPASAFNRPYRAYSAAIHEIQHGRGNAGASMRDGGREQVMFGGQSGWIDLQVCFTWLISSFQS